MSDSYLTWLVPNYRVRTMIDIGAHAGEYGAYLRDLFGAETVHAFEPNPEHSSALQARGFNVHAVALGNINLDGVEFKISRYDAASSLRDLTPICLDEYPQVEYSESITVPVRRLDDLIGEIEHDLLIKVDAQGFESEIIQGGLAVFAKADVVLIEMSFVPLYEGQALFNEVHSLLASVGLHFVGIKQQHLSKKDGRPLFAHCIYTRIKDASSKALVAAASPVAKNPIELLVTTFAATLHVTLDSDSYALLDIRTIHEGAGSYFGITWDSDHFYVLARNYSQPERGNQVMVFDRNFNLLREMNCGGDIREGHQIRAVDGKLLICNTNRNCLTQVTLADDSVENFYPLPASVGSNFNHFNTLSLHDNRLWLVAANRYRNSFFMCYEWPSMKLLEVDAVGLAAHNLVEWRGWKVICDSYHGALVLTRKGADATKAEYPMHVIHLLADSNEVGVESIGMSNAFFRERRGAPVFLRGLAITDNLALVGISEFTKRAMRNESLSRLVVIDGLDRVLGGQKPSVTKTIELGRYGAVMDVRILNRKDCGHEC
jgi:FkbM family methyltransferase